jgi:hypothetical protein
MLSPMATWQQFCDEQPVLAGAVRARFAAGPTAKHHVLATLRADGSPRVSGTEVGFAHGELFLGSMPGARKALDLQRDPRCAVHAHPGDSSMDGGDAKVSGRAVEALDPADLARFRGSEQPAGPYHLFLVDLTEAVLTTVDGDELVVSLWRPGQGVRTVRRH